MTEGNKESALRHARAVLQEARQRRRELREEKPEAGRAWLPGARRRGAGGRGWEGGACRMRGQGCFVSRLRGNSAGAEAGDGKTSAQSHPPACCGGGDRRRPRGGPEAGGGVEAAGAEGGDAGTWGGDAGTWTKVMGCSSWRGRMALLESELTGPADPCGTRGKEPDCQCRRCRDAGSIPGLGRSPGEGNGYALWYSCLENPMDRGAWWAMTHGVTKSWT